MATETQSLDVEQEALLAAGRELGIRLGAVVFLAGQVRSTRFSEALGIERIELPVMAGKNILQVWVEQMAWLRGQVGGQWPVRVRMQQGSGLPAKIRRGPEGMQVSCDPVAYRGTAGVLSDVTADLADDQEILVVAGPCWPTGPVDRVVATMAQQKADVVLVDQADGLPCGLMLVKRRVLVEVPQLGFWDFKERWLPRLQARGACIQVVDVEEPLTLPVRTLTEYLRLLRRSVQAGRQRSERQGPFAENLTGTFRLVDGSAEVGEDARILDSVVLPGAQVGAGALVVRSVVGAGAVVKPREQVIDRLVAAPRKGDER